MMQQTQTYKLNKPETTDVFTPAPLNENADKLEGALTALDGRVTTLEAHRAVVGGFEGNGTTQTIELGFTPIFVLVYNFNVGLNHAMATQDRAASGMEGGYHYECLKIVEGGFTVQLAAGINTNRISYNYLAII